MDSSPIVRFPSFARTGCGPFQLFLEMLENCVRTRDSSCRPLSGCPLRASPGAVELIPAVVCSVVTTWYTVDSERTAYTASHASAEGVFEGSHVDSLRIHPSPGIMFMGCLILGCSVSCFLYRHHHDDQYQPLVFTVIIAGSVVLGHLVGATLNMIMLGFVPWAACIAMVLSAYGHALLRWLRARSLPAGKSPDEKAIILT
ncbi:hypothetical protein VM1G_01832 [Cytospora mali]|uniref:Uncharacterized protein n=1 Tax=Cytospora mali TaxID=578113 RepID=A0A194VQR4_CYTMA|nr:hypothetical protein VM1G_01832 [Valsa mali]